MQNNSRMQTILSTGLMFVVGVIMLLLFFRETPISNKELVSLALGVLLGALKDVFAYYFNSTQSSDRKDAMIQTALNSAPQVSVEAPPPGSTTTVHEGPPITVTTEPSTDPQPRNKS